MSMIWRAPSKPPGKRANSLGVSSKGAERDAVEAVLDGLDNGALRVAEKIDGEWKVHQWLKKAVLLSFRLNDMKLISGAPGGAVWWDKVDSKFLGWDEAQIPRRRFPRRAGRDRAPLGLHRQGRGADAQLRQCRRPGGRRHHDRHLGHGRLLRPGGRALPYLRRRGPGRGAGAAAGRAHHHRGQLLHRRPRRSGRRRDRGRRQRAVDGRLSVRLDQDRGPRQRAKSSWARCRPIRWWCRARCRPATDRHFTAP